MLQDNDPNIKRSTVFKLEMDVILSWFHELQRVKKATAKQSALSTFFPSHQPSISATGPSDLDLGSLLLGSQLLLAPIWRNLLFRV
jgi:hypothetical protein